MTRPLPAGGEGELARRGARALHDVASGSRLVCCAVANENLNDNTNDNTNENSQDQDNAQDQDNGNEQTNNVTSSPEVNIGFGE